MNPQEFFDLSPAALDEWLARANLPRFRARQLIEWVWQKGVSSYDKMTNLSETLRTQFSDCLPLHRARILARTTARDKTRKYVLEFSDGAAVETVGIPDTGEHDRLTVCVSSQVGCALGCTFCATGTQGLTRNLKPGEIAEQVRVVADDFGKSATNVVVMGQGEPFLNYEATLGALRIMNDPHALSIGARRITVSTSGILTGIRHFAEEPEQFRLAISLHAALQPLRDELMPGLHTQPLTDLHQALVDYQVQTGRRVSLEYALMAGRNDTPETVAALISFTRGLKAHVNLIPLNAIEDSPVMPISPARTQEIADTLRAAGIETSVRQSRGSEIAAACGQLLVETKAAHKE